MPRGALLPDPSDTRVYVRLYDYTKASAVERLRHRAIGESGHDFTRTFEVPTATTGVNAGLPLDRLSRIAVASSSPSSSPDYVYDALGQLIREGTARQTAWSASGKPRSFRVQVEHGDGTAAAPSVYARYLYDGSGTRVRKVTRQQDGGGLSETDLGGVRLEVERDAVSVEVRTESTTALPEGFEVRAGTAASTDGRPDVRQRLMDRNGSAVATVGAATIEGAYVLVSREEYFPYGETALGGAVRASSRFDGKRRDAESGMYDYGLRTYAAWTCRFTSVDPLVREYPELSAYGYAGGRPVTMIDLDGAEPSGQDATARTGTFVMHSDLSGAEFIPGPENRYIIADFDATNVAIKQTWLESAGGNRLRTRQSSVELASGKRSLLDIHDPEHRAFIEAAMGASENLAHRIYAAELDAPSFNDGTVGEMAVRAGASSSGNALSAAVAELAPLALPAGGVGAVVFAARRIARAGSATRWFQRLTRTSGSRRLVDSLNAARKTVSHSEWESAVSRGTTQWRNVNYLSVSGGVRASDIRHVSDRHSPLMPLAASVRRAGLTGANGQWADLNDAAYFLREYGAAARSATSPLEIPLSSGMVTRSVQADGSMLRGTHARLAKRARGGLTVYPVAR